VDCVYLSLCAFGAYLAGKFEEGRGWDADAGDGTGAEERDEQGEWG
jgi:hypothetical protein